MALTLRRGGMLDVEEAMVTMVDAFSADYGEAWNQAQCVAILSLPGVWLMLAREGDDPCGFALVRVVADEAELLLLATRPGHRRQGVATALMQAALADTASRGAHRIHLEVRDNNPAIRFYKGMGFDEVGRRPAYYTGRDGKSCDALTLSRTTND